MEAHRMGRPLPPRPGWPWPHRRSEAQSVQAWAQRGAVSLATLARDWVIHPDFAPHSLHSYPSGVLRRRG